MAVPANKIRIAAAMGSEGFPLLPIFKQLRFYERPVTYGKKSQKNPLRKSSG